MEVYGNISFLDLLHFTISEFSEKEINTYSTEDVFSILRSNYEVLKGEKDND